jgi:hypothetical protein
VLIRIIRVKMGAPQLQLLISAHGMTVIATINSVNLQQVLQIFIVSRPGVMLIQLHQVAGTKDL